MKFFIKILLVGLVFLGVGAWAEEGLSPESEAWNAGIAAYRDGDFTNALERLRPLMQVKTHAARAAELVARIEHDRARERAEAGDSEGRLEHLESAAAAAQTVLRSFPADARKADDFARANANFTRATDGLADLREEVRVKRLLEAAGNQEPSAVIKATLADLRSFYGEAKALPSLAPAERVSKGDDLERRARERADALLVFGRKLEETAPEAAESVGGIVGTVRADVARSATQFADLDPEAVETVARAESAVTELYRATLDAWSALDEDRTSQTNALAGAAEVGARTWQADALAYTKAFRERFPQWAEEYEQSRQTATNQPPLTAEARQQIESLASELEEVQTTCCRAADKQEQARALDLMRQILELRPRPPQDHQQQQNQQQQDQQQQKQDQQKQDQKKQDQKNQDQKKQDPQEQQGGQGQQDQQQDESGKDEKDPDGERKEEDGQQGAEDEKEDEGKPEDGEDGAEKKDGAAEAQAAEPSEQEKADREKLLRVLERSAEHKARRAKEVERRSRGGRDW